MKPMRSASSSAVHELDRRPDLERPGVGVRERLVAQEPGQLADDLAELLGLGRLVPQDAQLVADGGVLRHVEVRPVCHGDPSR